MAKLQKKLRELERRRAKQRARIAAMTPAQRAEYDAWQRSHKPGGAAARELRRRDRQARATLEQGPRAGIVDAETVALAETIAALKKRQTQLEPN